MIPTSELFRIVETEHIFLEFADLHGHYLGIYLWDPYVKKACIQLERQLNTNERLLRCVLAHELGHHFRSAGQQVIAASATGALRVTKGERMATNWAVDKLVPGDKFLQLVHEKRSFEEVMDHFFVTPEFVINRAQRVYRNLPAKELEQYLGSSILEVLHSELSGMQGDGSR